MLPDQMAAESKDVVRIESRGAVRIVTLDRPPVNAIDLPTVRSLGEAFTALRDEAACKALVVTGRAGVFSAGIDTRAVPGYDRATAAEMLRTVNRTIAVVYGMPKPVVAAVGGHALGAGLVLPIAADHRIVADGDFKLGLTEASAGVPFPAGPLAVCQAALSAHAFSVLALGSAAYGPRAPELAEIVDRVVAPEALVDAAVAEAEARLAIVAYGRVKMQVREPGMARLRRIIEEDDDPMLAGWV
jgi:enoyl-CoA hydratase